MMKTLTSSLCLAALLTASASVAMASPGLLPPERYIACPKPSRGNSARAAAAPKTNEASDDLLPMPSRRPRKQQAAPRQEIDIVHWHPIPNAPPQPELPPPPPRRYAQLQPLNYRCVGFERGKNGILHVLAAPPGTRYRGRADWLAVNMTAAALFNHRRAIPWLQRQLQRPIEPKASGYQKWRRMREHLNAMRALADLQVRNATTDNAALRFVKHLETASPTMWRDSLESFRRLAPGLAQRYAIERLQNGRVNNSIQPLVDVAQRLLYAPDAPTKNTLAKDALAALTRPLRDIRRDTTRTANCKLLAARVLTGDETLRRTLRPEFAQGLTSLRATVCFSQLLEPVFPANEAASIDAYILRAKYALMVKWAAHLKRLERSGPLTPAWAKARARLKRALPKIMATPRISGGKHHRDYVAADHGRVLLIRQALGETITNAQLDAVVANGDSRRIARWTMPLDALRLGAPHAAARATAALRWGISHSGSRIYPRFEHRSGHVIEEQGRLVEALADAGDPHFVLGLLQKNIHPYSVTLERMSRDRPKAACRIVAQAAKDAKRTAVQRAFWALSVYGNECEADFLRIAQAHDQPEHVVSMAIEMLAMIRSDETIAQLQHLRKPRTDHRARVDLILNAPEEAPAPTLP